MKHRVFKDRWTGEWVAMLFQPDGTLEFETFDTYEGAMFYLHLICKFSDQVLH